LFGSQRINEVTPGVLGSLLLPRSNQGRYQFSPKTFFSRFLIRITSRHPETSRSDPARPT
jgi:hypothetical protein